MGTTETTTETTADTTETPADTTETTAGTTETTTETICKLICKNPKISAKELYQYVIFVAPPDEPFCEAARNFVTLAH